MKDTLTTCLVRTRMTPALAFLDECVDEVAEGLVVEAHRRTADPFSEREYLGRDLGGLAAGVAESPHPHPERRPATHAAGPRFVCQGFRLGLPAPEWRHRPA